MDRQLRVLVACPGVDHVARGYETFARQAFRELGRRPGLEVTLLKGDGPTRHGERAAWCLRREGRIARTVQRVAGRPYADYEVEQVSFVPALYRAARSVDVVLTSDQLAARALHGLRRRFGGDFAIVVSNGAPYPGPFPYADLVHQVTPTCMTSAVERGETPERMRLIPYAFETGAAPPMDRASARSRLGLPINGPLVVSVGALNDWHKRHRHLITEVARLPAPRPYLALVGNAEPETADIERLAHEELGDAVSVVTARPDEVATWLAAADLFALASLTEGFPRAVAEATLAGLPCILNDTDILRFVAQDHATYIDMETPGALTAAIERALATPRDDGTRAAQSLAAAARLSWQSLGDAYEAMLRDAATLRSKRSGGATEATRAELAHSDATSTA